MTEERKAVSVSEMLRTTGDNTSRFMAHIAEHVEKLEAHIRKLEQHILTLESREDGPK